MQIAKLNLVKLAKFYLLNTLFFFVVFFDLLYAMKL